MLRTFILIALMGAISFGNYSCKSKKKLAEEEAAAAEARKIAKAKADLESILTDDGSMSIEEKQNIIKAVKDSGVSDPEVLAMLSKAEAIVDKQLAELKAEELAREREERLKAESSGNRSLDDYFNDIATSGSVESANNNIQQALTLFNSGDAPVLIIIGVFDGEKDYDKPTTIENYLNYLKDQKKSPNKVESLEYDGNGKITSVELIKKQ